MKTEAQREHQWLTQLVGEWTYEGEAATGPDKPTEKFQGTESIRSIGDLWILCEGQGVMPDGNKATMLMTLGYDPQKKLFVGTWLGSMMTYLWVYEGTLDDTERMLMLNSVGPDMAPSDELGSSKTANYRDVIEVKSPDHRILTSHKLNDSGQWTQFMTARYQRAK